MALYLTLLKCATLFLESVYVGLVRPTGLYAQ